MNFGVCVVFQNICFTDMQILVGFQVLFKLATESVNSNILDLHEI